MILEISSRLLVGLVVKRLWVQIPSTDSLVLPSARRFRLIVETTATVAISTVLLPVTGSTRSQLLVNF